MFETVVNETYALTDQFRLGQSIYQTQTQNDAHIAALAGGGFSRFGPVKTDTTTMASALSFLTMMGTV